MAIKVLLISIFLVLSLSIIAIADNDYTCVYTVYIKTGSIIKGGTDSIIGLTLYDADANGFRITDIVAWGGLMGPGHDYFERGNLDIFSGRGPCLSSPACAVNLTLDGSGSHPGWYCKYVEVTTIEVHEGCAQQKFKIDQWLATDSPPYELSAFRFSCPVKIAGDRHGRREGVEKSKPVVYTI